MQVHQKSNKYKFKIINNSCYHSEVGYGAKLFDSGFLIENCRFNKNKEGGLHIDSFQKPDNPLPSDTL